MTTIKFGTDGWRAIIADTFTTANVARVAEATALWLLKYSTTEKPSVVIGFDCRFGGQLFMEIAIKVLCKHGIRVYAGKNYVSTPMVSLATLNLQADLGIVITASHNPPSYNGFKLKAHFGGPAIPETIAQVEKLIPDTCVIPDTSIQQLEASRLLSYEPLEEQYLEHVEQSFDIEAIKKSGISIAYDAMYGAGQNVMRRLFPEAHLLHCEYNPSFMGQAPEPIHKNLIEFSTLIKSSTKNIDVGIATDGDADRIGMYNNAGKFIDSHHIILLLVHYLHKYKGLSGKVVNAFSVSGKVKKMCAVYNLPYQVTKIGFKYICKIMIKEGEDILLGGEESGGIATKGHIPERDGIWMGLTILEFMAKSGKSLDDIIEEVYDVVGAFSYNRNDLHINNTLKWAIMDNCKAGKYQSFDTYTVKEVETVDGYKFHLSDNEWVMIRPSGTEPVLRVYAEAPNPEGVERILSAVKKTILS